MNARAVAAKAASLLLRYPDDEMLGAVPAVRAALTGLPPALARPLGAVAAHRSAGNATDLAAEYVALFDLRRRCCLHLSYYTAGDTRDRGQALLAFAAAYQAAGYTVEGGELPDFLPAVLDLAAHAGDSQAPAGCHSDRLHGTGWDLLRAHRVGLDLLVQALDAEHSVYRHAVQAVRAMLPPPGAADLAAAATLARTGPPREQVGLQPFALVPGGRR